MKNINVIIFDEEELTRTLIDSYFKEITFNFTLSKYSKFDENIIQNTEGPKIIIVNINKVNLNILKQVQLLSKDKKNNFIVISYDKDTDINVLSLRAGAKDFLIKPLVKADFIDSVKKIYKLIVASIAQRVSSRVFTAASVDRGVGKSLFLLNLAKGIADKTGDRVLLIDFNDNLNDISSFIDIPIRFNTPYFMNNLTPENAGRELLKANKYKNSSLYIMANGFRKNTEKPVSSVQVVNSLKLLKKYFKYIFVDADITKENSFFEIMRSADEIFYIITPVVSSADNIKKSLDTTYKSRNVKLIMNKYDDKCQKRLEQIQEILGAEVYAKLPRNTMAVNSATNMSKTLSELNNKTDIYESYLNVVKKVINRE
jgi:Flp pilus assembly CpaE family ATPase